MKYLLGAAAAALLIASASSALAAQASATVTANATVITPLTATSPTALDFGKLVMNASNSVGTLTVAPATGGRSASGGVDLVGGAAGQAGVVHLVGDSSNAYTVTIPSTASLTGPGAPISVTGIGSNTANLTTLSGTVDVNIGGTLNAGVAQAAGSYTGSFVVTAAYN